MRKRLHVDGRDSQDVLLIGNLNIDLIIRDIPHLPVWGQEVLGRDYLVASSGQSAYTAFALSRFHVGTKIISCVGDDHFGNGILSDLKRSGVDISSVESIENGRTGVTVAIVREDGERAFVSDPGALGRFDRNMVLRHADSMRSASLVGIVGSFFLPAFDIADISRCFEMAHEADALTFLDTGWDPDDWSERTVRDLRNVLKNVDFFLPNMDEAGALTGLTTPEKASERFLEDGCRAVIIKLGAEGSYLRTTDEEVFVPPFEAEVQDAVGAGDVYNAGFLFGTLQGWPFEARMIFGSATAAQYISRGTDRFPGLEETMIAASRNDTFEFFRENAAQ